MLYTLDFDISKTKKTISFAGHNPPDSLLQRYTSGFSFITSGNIKNTIPL